MRRAGARLALALACAALTLAAAAGQNASPPPPPLARPPSATSSDNAYDKGARFGGLPPLVFVGLCASVGLAGCAIAQALRRRCAVNAAATAAVNRAHTARMVEMLAEARDAHAFRLPPVRGVPLALPWPPVQGTPCYQAFGGELPPGYEEETRNLRVRVIRRVRRAQAPFRRLRSLSAR
jgi:hypothetical protein